MQKRTLLSLLTVCLCLCVRAQDADYRFGKVSVDELRMERYDKDPDAEAVILYEDNYLHYQITSTVCLVQEYRARIKVLKPEGSHYADVGVTYIDRASVRENVSGIDAAAYNLVDGKVVKTPLKRQYIFTEDLSKEHRIVKFSIPEVREGTVIEYKYRKTSDILGYIPSFVFQHDIPVAHSRMEADIPEFFRFNLNSKGYVKVPVSESSSIASLGSGEDRLSYTIREIKAVGTDIPALKNEPFVWCLDDFRAMLEFELAQIALPLSLVQDFTSSWKAVNEALEKSDFNTHTRINNPFKEEVAAIRGQEGSTAAKAHAVLRLVQSKMKWDGRYRLFSDGPRAAAGKGTGSSADINFVLMAALKDAGIEVVQVLLSPRHLGRLSFTHPTIDGINAFVLRISDGEGRYAYLDGTHPGSDINVLPVELSVDRARIYGVSGDNGWCNLTKLAQNKVSVNMILRIGAGDVLEGSVIEEYTNQQAFTVGDAYTRAKSKEEYIASVEKEQGIRIGELEIEGAGSVRVHQKYQMTRQLEATDEFVYLNATALPFMSTNQLNAQSRALPIEFPLPVNYDIRCSLELPDGYTIEELPKNIGISACEEGMSCRYLARAMNQYIQFNLRFQLDRIIYLPTEFQDVNTFYGMVTDLSNSRIVIRKNTSQQ